MNERCIDSAQINGSNFLQYFLVEEKWQQNELKVQTTQADAEASWLTGASFDDLVPWDPTIVAFHSNCTNAHKSFAVDPLYHNLGTNRDCFEISKATNWIYRRDLRAIC